METKDTLSSCSNSKEQQMQQIQDKAKKSCMVSFRQLHSHLKLLSNNDLKGTRTECGFKRAFATLFGQDVETFTGTMLINMDQLEKQLDKEEFQEIGSMAAFKKSINERAQHKREYDSRVNDRQMRIIEEKVDTSKALDANIRPIYDEEPMAEVQMTAKINVFAIGQQHTKQPEFNNEGEVDQNAEQCHETRPLSTKLTDNQKTELLNQSLESKNICLKKTVAQFQKDFSKLEAHCINLELHLQNNILKSGQQSQVLNEKSNKAKVKHDIDVIETINIKLEHKVAKLLKENKTLKKHYKELIKNELRKLKRNSVNTKFAKQSILGKPVLQPHRNRSVVRQPTAFKSKRPKSSKPRFASQVDVNNDFPKPVTTYYLPRERESTSAKPHHVNASSNSRNSSNNMPRFRSNDMAHNHYLEEAKNKTHDIVTNGNPSRVNLKQLCGRYKRWCCSLIQAESDSLPHAHAQTTKTYYKHQDSRIKKAQELKSKTSANSDIKDPSLETKLRGRLLESF
ncbi:hypothetical protein Tco_0363674 [Tanacetum coccineum]